MKENNVTFDNIDLPDVDNKLYKKNKQDNKSGKKSLLHTIKALFTRRK